MDNRFFSLLIVPDSGNEVKCGSFNFRLVFYAFGVLIITFFICLFFITGYHIKLSQEKEYKNARATMNGLLERFDNSKEKLHTLSDKLFTIQRNDIAYRKYAYMDVLDKEMYQAGIGGHVLVDDVIFEVFSNNIQSELKLVSLDLVSLDSRINVQEQSLVEIDERFQQKNEEYNYTPNILPTHSYRITENYGTRIHPVTKVRDFHNGVDLAGKIGNKIIATADGVVTSTGYQGALGNNIKIKHKYGYQTVYGHLSKFYVKPGQEVKKGDVIGAMGNTGRLTGVHIHYGINQFGKSVDPKKYF
ncbi:M23 family metallopeptidase [Candidatus Latescibacterota bacterium]